MLEQKIKGKRRLQRVQVKGDPYDFIAKCNIHDREEQILKFLFDIRVARTSQIASHLNVSVNWASKLLSSLYVNNFVYRDFRRVNSGSSEAFYFLDNMGAFYLASIFEMTKREFPWSSKDNLVGIDKLKHTEDITSIRVKLEEVMRKAIDINLIKFYGEKRTGRITFTIRNTEKVINPDVEMIIEKVVGERKRHKYYFLEYDRGTEELVFVQEKIKKYIDFYSSQEIENEYNAKPILIIVCNGETSQKRFMKAISDQSSKISFKTLIVQYEKLLADPLGNILKNAINGEIEALI